MTTKLYWAHLYLLSLGCALHLQAGIVPTALIEELAVCFVDFVNLGGTETLPS